jgi:hypothetical protein
MEDMEKDNRVDIMIYALGGVSIALAVAWFVVFMLV